MSIYQARKELAEALVEWRDAGGVHPKAVLFFGQSPMETAAVTSMDHGGGPFDRDGNEGPNKPSEKTGGEQ